MDSFGIYAVQKETVTPGLIMEKAIYGAYENDCVYQKIDDQTIIIDGNEFDLKNNVYY
jgi:hypothetical protein